MFVEDKGNRAVGGEFSVSEKILGDWRKQKAKLEKLPNIYWVITSMTNNVNIYALNQWYDLRISC